MRHRAARGRITRRGQAAREDQGMTDGMDNSGAAGEAERYNQARAALCRELSGEAEASRLGLTLEAFQILQTAKERKARIADGRRFCKDMFGGDVDVDAVFSDLHLLAVGRALAG